MRNLTALLFCTFYALPAQAEIFVGVAGPLSGQNTVYGNELRSGAAAAIAALNAKGGINGESLTLVEGDDACDAKRAIEVAKRFVAQDVRAVIGHFCSSASLAAAPTYASAGVLMLNPSATAPELTSKSLWNVFRLTGRDDAQAEIAAARIKAESRDVASYVITDGLAETASLAKRFLGALPTARVLTVKAGDVRIADEPGLIVASSIYFALQATDAADAARSIREVNENVPFFGSDILQSENYGLKATDAANLTHVTFLKDNATSAGSVAGLASNEGAALAAYAAVETFASAAKARSVNDSRGMAAWLSAGNEVQTVVGPLRFNASGDLQQQPYIWYQWRDGNLAPESP